MNRLGTRTATSRVTAARAAATRARQLPERHWRPRRRRQTPWWPQRAWRFGFLRPKRRRRRR